MTSQPNPRRSGETLRVAFVTGSLVQGGAEKQLVYMARALQAAGIEVRLYSLTQGEFYEAALRASGLEPIWIGRLSHPAARVAVLARALRRYRPHIVQSTHFFGNLYATIAGRLCGALAIGSIRNDARFDVHTNGRWGPWLLRSAPVLLANSWAARRNAQTLGVPAERVHVLPNVIDLREFGGGRNHPQDFRAGADPVALAVCRLVPMKRLDRFIRALDLARRQVPRLRGVIAGEGPERASLEALTRSMGGLDGALTFAGRIDEVPALMRSADMLVLSSDHEGFPNVILEAMSAALPVVATPAGDVIRIVEHGQTGYVVPFDEVGAMAAHMASLATTPALRQRLGKAGRALVEQSYTFERLGDRLLSLYATMAEFAGRTRTLGALQARPAA